MSGEVQVVPAMQAPQAPSKHTSSGPQCVPSSITLAVAVQAGAPEDPDGQETTPARQLFGAAGTQ
jgi:hypothetical protein